MSSVRDYPVPRAVVASASRASCRGLAVGAVRAARSGRVRGYHLPLLATGSWNPGARWAQSVLEREQVSIARRRDALLAAAGYDPDSYMYQGVLDPGYPDHELIVGLTRQAGDDSPIEKWDGLDWGTAEVGPDGLEYVVLDADVLADLLDALESGSSGLVLRPFEPRAWVRDAEVLDYPVLAAAPPPRNTDAMIAFPIDPDSAKSLAVDDGLAPDELHVTLAYLGSVEEDAVDHDAVQRAVARWARRMEPMVGGVGGRTARFGGDVELANVAEVECPGIQEAREMLVQLLRSEGVEFTDRFPAYSPHITLAYDHDDLDVPASQLPFERVGVYYGDEITHYDLGEPVVAAGTNPDIYYAVVDEFDTNAVLDLIRVLPGPVAYRRSAGAWVKDDKILMKLMGVDPPPVVEVDPAQAPDVLAQVDAYDSAHPPAVTSAAAWTEELHPRAGGKFASKNGGSARPSPKQPGMRSRGALRDLRSTDVDDKGRDGDSGRKRPTKQDLQRRPWAALNLGKNDQGLGIGLGDEFWSKQADGFRAWLTPFLSEQRKTGGPDWQKQVPAKYRDSMNQFIDAAGMKSAHGKQGGIEYDNGGEMSQDGPANDNAKRDREADLHFAKEGLGESRRREIFDRQLAGAAERLLKAGIDNTKIQRVMAHKIAQEKQRRAEFDRKRRTAAKQEQVRRMSARHRAADALVKPVAPAEPVTADASFMPAKLKKYWLSGEGAAKIRWNVGGDFGRCTRALAKYLPPNMVKGACANLHHLATGHYPGPNKGT